jgi:L-amino acid N-acyltransferase
MQFVVCDHRHSEAIGAILNDAIANSTAIYDYEPRSKETIDAWIASKQSAGLPIIGVESLTNKELMGFATFGPFRPWPAYQYSIEHSVYVDRRFRGQGIGRKLLEDLMAIATSHGYHMMIGGIDSENVASIQLHKALGFSLCAEIREAGFKFDRWLDLVFYQRLLSDPATDRR